MKFYIDCTIFLCNYFDVAERNETLNSDLCANLFLNLSAIFIGSSVFIGLYFTTVWCFSTFPAWSHFVTVSLLHSSLPVTTDWILLAYMFYTYLPWNFSSINRNFPKFDNFEIILKNKRRITNNYKSKILALTGFGVN